MKLGSKKRKDTKEDRNLRLIAHGFMTFIFFIVGIGYTWGALNQSLSPLSFAFQLVAGLSCLSGIFLYPYAIYRDKGRFWEVDRGIPKDDR